MKFSAVSAVVVLALTGFSSSHGHGHGSSGSSGSDGSGGGCSSSNTRNGTHSDTDYNDDYDDYDDDNSSSGSSATEDPYTEEPATAEPSTHVSSPDAYVSVDECASPKQGKRKAVTYSTVTVEAVADAPDGQNYNVQLMFEDKDHSVIDVGDLDVRLDAGESRTLKVEMDHPRYVSRAWSCDASAPPA